MSTSVTAVTKHFPVAQNGFTTTLASTISSGAVTVPLNGIAGYTNGDTVVLVIDPTGATKQTFTGVVDTAGVQITGVVWTAGTNVTHAGGATVVDYETATHWAMVAKGLLRDHNQSGYHKTIHDDNGNEWIEQGVTASAVNQAKITNAATGTDPVISASGDDTNIGLTMTPKGIGSIKHTKNYDAWVSGLTVPNTVAAVGNRSYNLTFNTLDVTGFLSPGMRLRTTRTVAAPTQSTNLNGTTQYYSKSSPSSMTFTDDFVVSAWVKLTSYPGSFAAIAARYDGTSGWSFDVNSTGQVRLIGLNAGAGNNRSVTSYQSLPLNKWVHVTAQLDMSSNTAGTTLNYVMFDGVDVPAFTSTAGSNPSALIQAGTLNIGAQNSLLFFTGKLAQVAIYNAKVTQATILASMNQGLSGSETSLISAYSFNNAITDLSANANNLTAQGSAVATNADSPFGGQASGLISSTLDYGIITAASFSTNSTVTVQVPEGCTIPSSGGVTALAYSAVKVPYGFPAQRGKWLLETINKTGGTQASPGNGTWYNISSIQLVAPIGEWIGRYETQPSATTNGAGSTDVFSTLSTANNSESDVRVTTEFFANTSNVTFTPFLTKTRDFSLAAQTTFYLNAKISGTNYSAIGLSDIQIISFENAYL